MSLAFSDFNEEPNNTNIIQQKKREGMRHNKTAKNRKDKMPPNPKVQEMMKGIHEGEAPPATLARLITPGVLVIQTADPQELEWIARPDGPRVLALMPTGAAQFRHDPAAGPTPADRIVITHLPEKLPRRLGVSSGFQQREDLAQLEALAAGSETSTRSVADAEPPPRDRSRNA